MGMVKMKHVNIYGPEKEPKRVLELLAHTDCFDPDDPAENINVAPPAENVYVPLETQLAGLLQDLGADAAPHAFNGRPFTYGETKKLTEKYAAQVSQRGSKKAEIAAKLATYAQTKVQLYHLTNLHSSMDEIFSVKYLKVRFGRLPKDSYIKLPYYNDKSFTFREYDFDGQFYWGMYFVPEDRADEVDAIFASLYFERIMVPDFVHGTPQDALAQIITEETQLQKEQQELNDMGDIASAETIADLQERLAWVNYEAQLADMQKYVILLEHSYYISGYVPEDKMATLQADLGAVRGVRVVEDAPDTRSRAEQYAADPKDRPPVKLKNNWFARPFEMFVEMYGLPGYGELDPTSFVAITYAILFGAMFGDVGQGLVLGLVGYFIMYKKMHLDVGLVLARCSGFSVLFGFVYGSVFGFEHVLDGMYAKLGVSALPLRVMEGPSMNIILLSSIAAGVFIITAAIITGILSNVIRGVWAKTVFSVNGLAGLVFYLSAVGLVVELMAGVDLPFVGSTVFYVVCIVIPFLCMFFAEPICALLAGKKPEGSVGELFMNGFFDLFDAMLSFMSNTMSFLRVGGFVLAHAGMMSVVATLAGMSTNPVLIAFIYVVGNLFVMVMEGLFVAIQVLRLEFYEVFSRFFEPTGRTFEPLHIQLAPVITDN